MNDDKPVRRPPFKGGGGRAQDRQVGGDHYVKRKIQPWDIFEAYPDMDPFIAHIIPYLLRWRDKGGLADLKKARHTLDRLIEIQEKKLDELAVDNPNGLR